MSHSIQMIDRITFVSNNESGDVILMLSDVFMQQLTPDLIGQYPQPSKHLIYCAHQFWLNHEHDNDWPEYRIDNIARNMGEGEHYDQ